MCEFCKEIINEHENSRKEELILQRDNGRLDLCCHAGGDDWGGIEGIKYCPMCGRKIESDTATTEQ